MAGPRPNAYGFIPHKLVEEALNRHHHIPDKVRDLILDYYNSFSLRVLRSVNNSRMA